MPPVLVDSSVWIDYLRSGTSRESDILEQLARAGQIAIADMIRVELLSGARTESEYRDLEDRLASIPLLEPPGDFWNHVALTRFRLARRGFQASIPDVALVVIARHHRCLLLTLDHHFVKISHLVPLKLYPRS